MHLDGDIVVAAITMITMTGMVTLGPIGRALADRLRGKAVPGPVLAELEDRLDDVSGQMQAMQRQLGELIDRQEFSERLLARAKERGSLEAPK